MFSPFYNFLALHHIHSFYHTGTQLQTYPVNSTSNFLEMAIKLETTVTEKQPLKKRTPKVLTPREIEDLIARGNTIVIYKKNVLKLNNWIKKHPGGDKAVHHMIGRDATDEMNAYHCDETVSTFLRFRIGVIDHDWVNMLPPIQGGHYRLLEGESLDSKNTVKLAGEMPADIKPVIPEGVIPALGMTELYPIDRDHPIRDPETVIANYDNDLVKQDLASLPSLDYETQRWLSVKYNELHNRIIDAGLYQCPYMEYFKQGCLNLGLFLYFAIFFKYGYYVISGIFLGLFWQQLTFVVHDGGHIAITHNFQVDSIISILIADWTGGLSAGWWKRNHNVHHLITNDPVHDPDIQHLPFFCVSSRLFGDVYSTYYERYLWFDKIAKFVLQYQHHLYYPILCFGRFNLYRLSWEYVLKGQGPRHGKAAWLRYFEFAGLSFFAWWYFYLLVGSIPTGWDRFVFIMVSHVVTMIVHVQITLSHFAMSTSDLGTSESFVARQFRTTMDVDCPECPSFYF
ncbi:unnamed protein product [Ambrosiozyma monospora]|uniref:Unnamed protein product n=1 Tax=Ambrosiozyma monospora TaxID=43982 RepID=A0ACB5SRN9_AMBMO|nr:unnamed protein product [Ambrosiozyma monospora]